MYASDLKHPSHTLEDKLHRLYTLNREKTIDLSFRPPFLNLLNAFGNPHLNLPPVIHIAGTNGKGSTIAILRSILEAQGYRVHAYTSPHLQRFNERIVLAGAEIKDEPLEHLIDEALALNNDGDVTFFEITTAIAFTAFARTPADICLLETGLGGRLDCTNVIETPLATVITNISHDHTEFLGETLAEIAGEKAGIIKDHIPCIVGAQNKAAMDDGVMHVLSQKASAQNAALYSCDADWIIEPFDNDNDTHMRFIYRGEDMILPQPSLIGPHQIHNAGTALATVMLLRDQLPVSHDAMCKGLKNAQWRGRLQHLESGALTDILPQGWALYLDGGHNEGAGDMIAQCAANWKNQNSTPLHLILGMMNHKDPKEFLKPLLPYIDSLSIIPISDEPKSLSASDFEKRLNGTCDITAYPDLKTAITAIIKKNDESGRILVAGSLYLAGHVLTLQGS